MFRSSYRCAFKVYETCHDPKNQLRKHRTTARRKKPLLACLVLHRVLVPTPRLIARLQASPDCFNRKKKAKTQATCRRPGRWRFMNLSVTRFILEVSAQPFEKLVRPFPFALPTVLSATSKLSKRKGLSREAETCHEPLNWLLNHLTAEVCKWLDG